MAVFSTLGLSTPVQKAAESLFPSPYPIQQQAIPPALQGKDILGIAQTGSGKTLAFALPVLEKVLQQKTAPKNRHITALVLVPTRELAMQVGEVFKTLSGRLPNKIKSLAVFGGVSINPQMMALQGVEILVATPGRLLDLVDSKAVHLSDTQILVLDEADKMLNLGFKDEMTKIFGLLPARRQNMLFSATLGKDVDSVTEILLQDPVKVEVKPLEENLDLITQTAYWTTEERKGPLLRYLIREKNMRQVLVFTSSVFRADAVAEKLNKNGIQAEALHSKKSQGARTETLRKFKSGELPVLVATDLASRGIDIAFLPYVVNYELPRSPKDYIHRIGRTGRAESSGEAISLVTPDEEHHFYVIQKKMKRRVPFIETGDLKF